MYCKYYANGDYKCNIVEKFGHLSAAGATAVPIVGVPVVSEDIDDDKDGFGTVKEVKVFKEGKIAADTENTKINKRLLLEASQEEFINNKCNGLLPGQSCVTKDVEKVDCVGSWGAWSACSKECGGGTQTRTYKITTKAEKGGDECKHENGEEETRECNNESCAVNCVGSWGEWGKCSADCGGGIQTRTYKITTKAEKGGDECKHENGEEETRECNDKPCDVDCVGSWGDWSKCSADCGGGIQTRTYKITTPKKGSGDSCDHVNGKKDFSTCNNQPCPDQEWEVVNNKVCIGKYISGDETNEKLRKYKGKRVGYGYYGKISLDEAKKRCKNNINCQSFHRDRNLGYYYYTGKDSEGIPLNDSHPVKEWITDFQKGVCTRESAQVENRGTGATLYIKKNKMNKATVLAQDTEWEVVNNKVCIGKYISGDETKSKLQKYKGKRVGYGYYGKISLDEAKKRCKNNINCQSFHRDRNLGYYYYTGKDSEGIPLNDSHPVKEWITDFQKGVCTRESAQVENRGTGATLYIKK